MGYVQPRFPRIGFIFGDIPPPFSRFGGIRINFVLKFK